MRGAHGREHGRRRRAAPIDRSGGRQDRPSAAATTFPTGLHVGISNTTGATSLGLAISFAGPNAPNPPEVQPRGAVQEARAVREHAGGAPKPPDPELLEPRPRPRRRARGRQVAARCASAPTIKQRLDLHLEGLGQLQQQIVAAEMPKATGTINDPDKAYPMRGADGSISRQRGQAFSDLLVFAMASDLTRVFSYMFTLPGVSRQLRRLRPRPDDLPRGLRPPPLAPRG